MIFQVNIDFVVVAGDFVCVVVVMRLLFGGVMVSGLVCLLNYVNGVLSGG